MSEYDFSYYLQGYLNNFFIENTINSKGFSKTYNEYLNSFFMKNSKGLSKNYNEYLNSFLIENSEELSKTYY